MITKITHQHGLVARVGGEEFVAVLGVGEDTARAIARAIQRDMDLGGMLFGKTPVRATISIGVATFNGETNFDYAFPKADLALYAAKRLGRNRVEYAPTEPGRLAA